MTFNLNPELLNGCLPVTFEYAFLAWLENCFGNDNEKCIGCILISGVHYPANYLLCEVFD